MTGYTPAFNDIYTGSLYGRWPAAAVWASLLPLLDRHGQIDMSMQAIAGMTGWPIDLLGRGIAQLMEPDPGSRSADHDGRRLIQMDPKRQWGWVAVNHEKYREKARLQAKNSREVESGKNRERLRSPPTTADDRRPPPLHTPDTIHQTPEKRARATRLPSDFELTNERRFVAEAERLPAERTFQKFVDYWKSASGSKSRKLDWDATWRNWCLNEADRKPGGTNGRPDERNSTERSVDELLRR